MNHIALLPKNLILFDDCFPDFNLDISAWRSILHVFNFVFLANCEFKTAQNVHSLGKKQAFATIALPFFVLNKCQKKENAHCSSQIACCRNCVFFFRHTNNAPLSLASYEHANLTLTHRERENSVPSSSILNISFPGRK